tara:strand:- start:8676 stop:10589 length:1914 start_codon:yes stop_codon:yes gene_type:complete
MLSGQFLKFWIKFLLIFLWISSSAQVKTTKSSPFRSNILTYRKPNSSVSFSGFYRFLGFVRNQVETFPNNSGKTTVISSGDNYREPMFLLKLNGRTRENVTFGADFMINSLYKGPSEDYISPLTLNLGLNLTTTFLTEHGIFKLKSGGISWYRQSRLTVWGNRSFNRISLFERRPQTPLNQFPFNRYSKYYNSGLLDQGIRYGSRAFQGLFIQGTKLPLNFSVKGVIGKSNFNRSFLESSDNFTGCFQLKNILNQSTKISYNYLSSWADTDSLSYDRRNYFIHSLEIDKKINKLQFQMELGIGNYTDPEKKLGFGEAIVLNVKTAKTYKVPLDIQLYRISPQFVNVTGNFLNTTVLEVFPNVAGVGTTVRTPYQSPMVGLGFPVNNRQGASINADLEVGKFRFNAGIGVFAEIDTSYASLSYIHNVNSQTLSRIFLFGQNWGPYNSLNSTYRRVFENVNISDTSKTGLANFKKFFNTIEFQAKYKNQAFGKNYYIFSLTRLNTCQKNLVLIPKFGERTLISQLSQEIDFSIGMSKKAVFILSYGIQKVLGNSSTDIGDNPEASVQSKFFENLGLESLYKYTNYRNQTNTMLGFGIDYKINDNVYLFLRSTKYRYFDPNFIENHLKGFETMLELKINF